MRCQLSYIPIVIIIILCSLAFCQDTDTEENLSDDSTREMRDLDQYGWRAMGSFHEGDLGWVPRGEARIPDQVRPKRRRLRKRKRRPPITDNSDEVQYLRRRIRPYRLEPWEEITEEDIKPIKRRRKPQRFPPSEEVNDGTFTNRESIIIETIQNGQEKPIEAFTSTQEKLESFTTQNSREDNLNQSESKLSPSETLYKQNITLLENSNENEKVIGVFTEQLQKTISMIEPTTELTTKYRRLPPSVALKKEIKHVQDDESLHTLSEKETLEAQRKRLSLLQPKENKLYSNLIKYDIVTEPTTERRIFIPVRSKHNEEENNVEIETTTEQKVTSTFRPIPQNTNLKAPIVQEKITITTTTPKGLRARSKLPTTNAKLRVTTNKVIEKPQPALPKPVKISISEITGFIKSSTEKSEELIIKKEHTTEGPMRILIDLETMFQNGSIPYIVEINSDNSSLEPTTNVSDYQNETYVTAKEEIMEVMKDPISREKLSKILQNRNMTLEELVEQRERGSSQRHLADIFHNNTREPEPKDEPLEGQISEDFFDNSKINNRQQKSKKFDDEVKIVSTTTSSTTEKQLSTESDNELLPTYGTKVENEVLETFPWKQLYPNLFLESNENVNTAPVDNVQEIIQRLENDNSYALNSDNDGFFLNIPSGVKSALFVSLAIIGLSIVVFLAILVVFKWLHKKKTSLNYCSNLTTKFKSPMIIQGRPTTAIKTFMNETLGRKKNYYKTNLQSMSDEIWDSSKERKESF